MNKYYITFGQVHAHAIAGITYDRDCVAELEAETRQEAHQTAMEIFDGKFHQCVTEKECDEEFMSYFPRGILKV